MVGRLQQKFRNERPDGSLGDAALGVLMRLHKQGPKSLTELSELHGVSPASMSKSVNRLTSAGYALRSRDPEDKRKVLFSTTAEGDKVARAARAERNAWLSDQLNALSRQDRTVIERAIAALNKIAGV